MWGCVFTALFKNIPCHWTVVCRLHGVRFILDHEDKSSTLNISLNLAHCNKCNMYHVWFIINAICTVHCDILMKSCHGSHCYYCTTHLKVCIVVILALVYVLMKWLFDLKNKVFCCLLTRLMFGANWQLCFHSGTLRRPWDHTPLPHIHCFCVLPMCWVHSLACWGLKHLHHGCGCMQRHIWEFTKYPMFTVLLWL